MNVIRNKRNSRVNRPRPQQVPRKPIPWRAIALGGIAILTVGAAGMGVGRLLDRPVALEVLGSGQRVSEMEVLAVLAPFNGAGFLAVDLDAVRAAAESLPWVDRARVQRDFPAQLRVTITEQVAAARWGEQGLLNTRGELFATESRFGLPELPGLSGPEGSEWRVAQRYLEVHRLITPLAFDVRSLRLGARGSWDLTLSTGLQIRLGRRDTEIRLLRLANVVAPRIQDLQARVEYIDLRYSNGFVIGWKPGQVPVEQSGVNPEARSKPGHRQQFAKLAATPVTNATQKIQESI